jgi:hypothetical protein
VEGEAFADGHREMTECGQNQRVFFVTFTTDNRAEETSFQLIGPSGGIIGRAPVNGQRFQDRTQYTFRYCVRIGYQYKLRWQDTGGNGMVSFVDIHPLLFTTNISFVLRFVTPVLPIWTRNLPLWNRRDKNVWV